MLKIKVNSADIIKVAAVVTAMPRWVGALLTAEGLAMPASWLDWWLPVSAIFAAAMAVVEGWAFAYVFNAWRNQRDKRANRLLWLAMLSACAFIVVLAPYIAAQVRGEPLRAVLSVGPALWLWSIAVAASTITIVASVGYAQKEQRATYTASESRAAKRKSKALSDAEPAKEQVECAQCGRFFDTVQARSGHKQWCVANENSRERKTEQEDAKVRNAND